MEPISSVVNPNFVLIRGRTKMFSASWQSTQKSWRFVLMFKQRRSPKRFEIHHTLGGDFAKTTGRSTILNRELEVRNKVQNVIVDDATVRISGGGCFKGYEVVSNQMQV